MAVLPASAPLALKLSLARFRQRKILVRQPLAIYKQKELLVQNDSELEHSHINHLSLGATLEKNRDTIETGVDKNEEDEVHLQQVIHAAQRALLLNAQENTVYIPTPDALKIWPEASKYYSDQHYVEPETYVKYSATVEDTVGVMYCMDEEDEKFLKLLAPPKRGVAACSELEFETVCDHLERAIEQKQPFLLMDPLNILLYDELKQAIVNQQGLANIKDKLSTELKYRPFITIFDKHHDNPKAMEHPRAIGELLKLYGPQIYEFWKERKIKRGGKLIHPKLKFEDPHAPERDNDNDPYVCFRRREFRQARKTRRADTLGAERLRHMQRLLQTARELVLSVAKREILKLDLYKAEATVFNDRVAAKQAKRAANVTGDEHLFYPAKRPKIVVKVEDEERESRRRRDAKAANGLASGQANSLALALVKQERPAPPALSLTSQPYVKLPPAKIPDMDLVSVLRVLREKHDTIERAVAEKLRKRREQDRGYVNLTDDPRQPYFTVTSHPKLAEEVTHIPYSLIAAAAYHDINTTHYANDTLKRMVDEGKKPLPGVKTIKNGVVVPTLPFPLEVTPPLAPVVEQLYISQFLNNVETNNFGAYLVGYSDQWRQQQRAAPDKELAPPVSETPFMRLRKRQGRMGTFVDRRGQVPFADVDTMMAVAHDDDDDDDNDDDGKNVYNAANVAKRAALRWLFDTDMAEDQLGALHPFGLDPLRLNCILDDTQLIRFGLMLLLKLYGLLNELIHQRQQMYLQQARLRALQQNKQAKPKQ